jgi:hypothetical protein
MRPEDALAAARIAAAARDDALAPGIAIEPTERVSIEQLMEWAAIEPDIELMVSTRRLGAPITWFKRKVIHFLRQYLRELNSQQTRFNLNLLIRVAELEDRVGRLEEGRAPEAAPGALEAVAPAAVARSSRDAIPAPELASGAAEVSPDAAEIAEVADAPGAPGA